LWRGGWLVVVGKFQTIFSPEPSNHEERHERDAAVPRSRGRIVGGCWQAACMPKSSGFEWQAVADLMQKQHGLLSRAQSRDCGMPPHLLKYRIRQGGPWQQILPRVYLDHTGPPTDDQRELAALLYGGPGSVLTGPAALRRHGLDPPLAGSVDVLLPLGARRTDAGFARLHRTGRLPDRVCVDGPISFVLPPRAVADCARGLPALSDVRAVVAHAVQRGRCPIPLLAEELSEGPKRGSALLRQALSEVSHGIRSIAEAELRDLIIGARLPEPLFNPRLFVRQTFLASPDCWWPHAGVVAEVDSRAWHFSPDDWERTIARHDRMSEHGILVLHFTPSRIHRHGPEVVGAIHNALKAGRALPHIRTLPAS
jgi:hypothetical protein